jgi:hypothetical protein
MQRSTLSRLVMALMWCLGVTGCGSASQNPSEHWRIDVAHWTDCQWPAKSLVYLRGGEVRRHLLQTGDDQLVWSSEALQGVVGHSDPRPVSISLSSDRRWMAVGINLIGSPDQLYALSCDGKLAQRLGPPDAAHVSFAKIAPDQTKMSVVFRDRAWSDPEVLAGSFVVDLTTGELERQLSEAGGAQAWSPDSQRLLHTRTELGKEGDFSRLNIATISGSAPELIGKRNIDPAVSCAWDGNPAHAYCAFAGSVVKWPFDESLPLVEISALGGFVLSFGPDGMLYLIGGMGGLQRLNRVQNRSDPPERVDVTSSKDC